LAPFHLHKSMLEKVEAAAAAAREGKEARIVLKMNALTDEPLARALAHASQQGVKIELIVRGACILPAQVPGVTDNVRVRSVIGRLLEHSRVCYFRVDGAEELWLSSADWMNRNMLRRVELAWPVTDPACATASWTSASTPTCTTPKTPGCCSPTAVRARRPDRHGKSRACCIRRRPP
jgi:polyphosphate kinase